MRLQMCGCVRSTTMAKLSVRPHRRCRRGFSEHAFPERVETLAGILDLSYPRIAPLTWTSRTARIEMINEPAER